MLAKRRRGPYPVMFLGTVGGPWGGSLGDRACKDVDVATTALETALDDKQRLRAQQGPMLFEQLRSHDDVHQTGFVLDKEQEHDAVGGRRTLAGHHEARRNSHGGPMVGVGELRRLSRAGRQNAAKERNHVPSGRDPGGLVGADHLLEPCLGRQFGGGRGFKRERELSSVGIATGSARQCAEFPEHAATGTFERVACPGSYECRDLFVGVRFD